MVSLGRVGRHSRLSWVLGMLFGCGPAIEASEADTDATTQSPSSGATSDSPDGSTSGGVTSSATVTEPTSSSGEVTSGMNSSSGGTSTSGAADSSSTGSGPVICHVPSTYPDPQSAIDDPSCEIIELEPGKYWGSLVIDRDVEIRGNEALLLGERRRPGSVITIGQDTEVRIELVHIEGGHAYEGGGIHNAGSLELEGVILVYNTAQRAGAGIYSSGPLTIIDGYLTNNYAGPDPEVLGGAVCVEGADLVVEDTYIGLNQADAEESHALGGGGGIAVRNGTAVLRGQTRLEGNYADAHLTPAPEGELTAAGGGVYVDASTLVIEPDVEIYNNLAEVWLPYDVTGFESRAQGGGIFVRSGTVDVTGPARIDWNFAVVEGSWGSAAGGGLYICEESEARLELAELTDNGVLGPQNGDWDVQLSGGAIAIQQRGSGESELVLAHAFIHDNQVGWYARPYTGHGGAVSLQSFDGGLVTASVANTTIADNRLYGSVATGGGLGVRAEGSGSQALVEMLNTTLSGNAVETTGLARAGGMALRAHAGASASALLRSVTLYGNTVSSDMNTSAPAVLVDPQDSSSATIDIGGSVVHGHLGEDCTSVGTGSVTATAPNAWGDPSGCPTLNQDDAWIGPDPMLGPLADAGGPTPVHLPAMASPLIDALPVDTCVDQEGAALATDQRGLARPQATACDLGAVERQPLDP